MSQIFSNLSSCHLGNFSPQFFVIPVVGDGEQHSTGKCLQEGECWCHCQKWQLHGLKYCFEGKGATNVEQLPGKDDLHHGGTSDKASLQAEHVLHCCISVIVSTNIVIHCYL